MPVSSLRRRREKVRARRKARRTSRKSAPSRVCTIRPMEPRIPAKPGDVNGSNSVGFVRIAPVINTLSDFAALL